MGINAECARATRWNWWPRRAFVLCCVLCWRKEGRIDARTDFWYNDRSTCSPLGPIHSLCPQHPSVYRITAYLYSSETSSNAVLEQLNGRRTSRMCTEQNVCFQCMLNVWWHIFYNNYGFWSDTIHQQVQTISTPNADSAETVAQPSTSIKLTLSCWRILVCCRECFSHSLSACVCSMYLLWQVSYAGHDVRKWSCISRSNFCLWLWRNVRWMRSWVCISQCDRKTARCLLAVICVMDMRLICTRFGASLLSDACWCMGSARLLAYGTSLVLRRVSCIVCIVIAVYSSMLRRVILAYGIYNIVRCVSVRIKRRSVQMFRTRIGEPSSFSDKSNGLVLGWVGAWLGLSGKVTWSARGEEESGDGRSVSLKGVCKRHRLWWTFRWNLLAIHWSWIRYLQVKQSITVSKKNDLCPC